jgi:hypothetical protein
LRNNRSPILGLKEKKILLSDRDLIQVKSVSVRVCYGLGVGIVEIPLADGVWS